MIKFLIILILSTGIISASITTNLIYDDIIVNVYNSSCIETVNYQFVNLNNMEVDKSNIGNRILVSEIEQLSKKSLLANIVLLT